MIGLTFAFFAFAILLFFSTGYTLLVTVERSQDYDERKKWKRYGLKLGILSLLFLGMGIWLYVSFH
ncbi:hypothetical protein [Alkalihalobacterium chitinilyticum]|uniref:Uncharacterized protein n=1 Tax=Alkalihalobacterium chitinilyticum TaxID=2980103 RepID=A0ABT5VIH6_9BACI|nr:hypothetical protein [Alkalihalobacterium chitinilyticum]MDE5414976.1 hypothetical protein [Alkalihalobacterium chitinilyticum]